MSHTYLVIHQFLIREFFQTKTLLFLECTTLLTLKSTIQVIHNDDDCFYYFQK